MIRFGIPFLCLLLFYLSAKAGLCPGEEIYLKYDAVITKNNADIESLKRDLADCLSDEIGAELEKGHTDLEMRISEYKKLGTAIDKIGTNKEIKQWQAQIQTLQQNQEKNCTAVHLEDQFGAVRDQEKSGLCYAFATADLIKFKTKKSVSYLDLALQTKETWTNRTSKVEDLNGGSPFVSLQAVKRSGVCSTDQFPDEQNSYNAIKYEFDLQMKMKNIPVCPYEKDDLNSNMKDILRAISKQNFTSISEIVKKYCEPREKILDNINIHNFGYKTAMSGIDQGLTENEPSVISVYGRPFGNHAMVVVGRYWNEGTHQCQYTVRNSWGPCTGYGAKDMEGLGDFNISCLNGNLLIQHDTLDRLLTNAVYLK